MLRSAPLRFPPKGGTGDKNAAHFYRLAAAALFLAYSPVSAHAADESSPANEKLKGFRYVLKPGLTYQKTPTATQPPITQDVSLAFSNHFGWGIPIGPIVLSPGASVPIYFFDAGNETLAPSPNPPGTWHLPGATLAVLGEVEVHLPLRWISLYGLVGAGGAFFFASNQQGGVFRGGGGIMVYPRSWIGIGAQATFLAMSNPLRGSSDGLQALEMTWPVELRF